MKKFEYTAQVALSLSVAIEIRGAPASYGYVVRFAAGEPMEVTRWGFASEAAARAGAAEAIRARYRYPISEEQWSRLPE